MSLFAESPSMPTMPSMPTISSPSVNKSGTTKNNSSTKTEKTQSAKTTSNVTAQSLLQMSSSNSLSSITDLASVLSGVSSENATEDDLKRISELFGTPLSSLSTSSTSSSSSNILLSQILQKLEELQNQIDKMNEVSKPINEQTKNETQTSQNQISEENVENSVSKKILRFKINNYDLTKSFTTLFFSEPEKDGSFLLTGDRTYNLYGKQMTETFYMLFKNENGNNFEVAVALNQNDENPNSFLYKFAKDSPYKSQRTGNLFFINSNKNDLKVDILIETK